MKNKPAVALVAIILATLFFVSCNNNPGKESSANNSSEDTNSFTSVTNSGLADTSFIKEAASGGMMEVELGNVAKQNGQSQKVKDFGAMMVGDHTKANNELKSITEGKSPGLSLTMNEEDKKMVEKLQKKNGADFDKAYIEMMVSDHKKDIDAFKKESETGNDRSIREFATKTLPTLQVHLDSAKAAKKYLNL